MEDQGLKKIKVIRNLLLVVIAALALILAFMLLTGCGDGNNGNYTAYSEPMYNWSMTDDGLVKYRWLDDGSCVLKSHVSTYTLPRHQHHGQMGNISWKWENDGDIDVKVSGRKYDLDSPFDPDDDGESYGFEEDDDGFGYREAAGGTLLGVGIGKMLHKKHKVYGYDKHGNPLDKKGKIIPSYDKHGKPVKLYDSKGKSISPTKASTSLENANLRQQLAAEQAKSKRQATELKRQQEANRKKNLLMNKQKCSKNNTTKSKKR